MMNKSRSPTISSRVGYLMYENVPRYDWVQKILIAAMLGGTLLAAIVLIFYDIGAGMAMFGVIFLDGLIFYFVLPRRYQVFNTKLRIVPGWPLGWDIPLSTIRKARSAPGIATWIYRGVRLATSSGTAVEIIRKKGWNVIISPSDRETFLKQFNECLKVVEETR